MLYLLSFLPAIMLTAAAKVSNDSKCHAEVSDEFRQTALYRFNFYREMLAYGIAPNQTGALPGAKNMYKLASFERCARLGPWPTNAIVMSAMYLDRKTLASAPDILTAMITGHIKEAQTYGVAAEAKVTINTINWGQYATGRRTRVGCSYRMKCRAKNPMRPFRYYMACVFDTSASSYGDPAYEAGSKCAQDSDCTTYPGSSCDAARGLCEYDGTVINPQCPKAAYSLTGTQRDLVVNTHNQLRSSLALGNEPDRAGFNAPPARRMTKMRYSCEAEKSVYKWTTPCPASDFLKRNNTGENTYYRAGYVEPVDALKEAMQQWWGELTQYGVGPDVNLTDAVWQRGVQHYTQMAWQETTEVGCGWAYCNGFTFVVCKYKPAGNNMNQLIYEPGPACQTDADCGSGRICLVDEALCHVQP